MTNLPEDARTRAFLSAIASRYAIEREIARGGMSRVYLAEDIRHRRRVAVKVLPPDIANVISTQRFLREIETAAGLTHPNILPLHDSGEAQGRLYYVMPYIQGPTLRDRLSSEGRIDLHEAIDIACHLADALDYAHRQGVVHRDIKPANILFAAGQPLLSDFGIALVRQAVSEPITLDGVVGTITYMSPEQAKPSPNTPVDARSDIYSLGVVLHEMLTGRLPDVAASVAPRTMRPHRRARGPTTVPARLRGVLRRSLAQTPGERFASSADFARALRLAASSRVRMARSGLAVALLIMTGSSAWMATHRLPDRDPVIRAHRVVVRPFEGLEGTNELGRAGTMAADWITEGLQATGVVDVVPTPTALEVLHPRTRGDSITVRQLADETEAGIVVTGSYYPMHDSLEIHVQVSDMSHRSTHLLGGFVSIRVPVVQIMDAIGDTRARVMGLLASTLDTRITEVVGALAHPPTFDAYREFADGLEFYTRGKNREAAEHFTRAFDRDSTLVSALLLGSISQSNAQAYAAADSLLDRLAPRRAQLSPIDRLWFDYRRSMLGGREPDALAAIRQIADAQPGTRATFNFGVQALQDGYLAEADRALRSLRPDRGAMRGRAAYFDALSRLEHLRENYSRELADAKRARSLDSTSTLALEGSIRSLAAVGKVRELASVLHLASNLQGNPTPAELGLEAVTELRAHGYTSTVPAIADSCLRWLDAKSRTGQARSYVDRLTYARLLYAHNEAARATDSAFALADQPALGEEQHFVADAMGFAGALAAEHGDTAGAYRMNRQLDAMPRAHTLGAAAVNQARIASVLGHRDTAVVRIRQALDEGHEYDLWLHRDPEFFRLRGYESFDSLTRPKTR